VERDKRVGWHLVFCNWRERCDQQTILKFEKTLSLPHEPISNESTFLQHSFANLIVGYFNGNPLRENFRLHWFMGISQGPWELANCGASPDFCEPVQIFNG